MDHIDYTLTQKQIDFYRKNGYLVVDELFSSEECNRMLRIMKQHAGKDFSAIMNLDRSIPELREVMKDPRVVDILETLQCAPIAALMSQILFKEVGSIYAAQAWNPHQDNTYPQAPSGFYITVNIFLANADKWNGSLYIYPGSHVEGLLSAAPTKSYRESPDQNPGNTVKLPDRYKNNKIDLNFKKGDMLVLHGDVVHGSYPNASQDRSRPLFSISYIKVPFSPGKNAQRMVIAVRDFPSKVEYHL